MVDPIKGHLVLAKYREDTSWSSTVLTHPELVRYISEVHTIQQDEMYGQESGAYISYILRHWESLPDFMIFSQADPFVHVGDVYGAFAEACRAQSRTPVFFRPLGTMTVIGKHEPLVRRCRSRAGQTDYGMHPVKTAYDYIRRELKPDWPEECPDELIACFGSIFMASCVAIRQYPKSFWEWLLRWVGHDNTCVKSIEAAIMERLWPTVLCPALREAKGFDKHGKPIYAPAGG